MSERRFAILIGNSQFPDEPKLTTLQAPANDVDGMNEVLTSKDLGGFTDISVLKEQSSLDARRKILSVLKKARQGDFVLIYYSGHGKLDPTGRLHLATKDTTVDELEATSIPITNIRDYVENTKCNQVALVLDCCFSGAAGGVFARGTVDDQLQIVSRGRGMYIMTASTELQIAQERPADKYGLFTKNVIEGLATGNADLNGDGVVTMDELYDYVHRRMREEGFQEPTKCAFDVRGELVIARSRRSQEDRERKRLTRLLIDSYNERTLPLGVLTEALDSIKYGTANSDPRGLLLNQLVQEQLSVAKFVEAWGKIIPSGSSENISNARSPNNQPSWDTAAKRPAIAATASEDNPMPSIAKLQTPTSPASDRSILLDTTPKTVGAEKLAKSRLDLRTISLLASVFVVPLLIIAGIFYAHGRKPVPTETAIQESLPECTDPAAAPRPRSSNVFIDEDLRIVAYEAGSYCEKFGDNARAVKWYTQAAELGDSDGYFKLGYDYELGLGVPKDKVTAYMWYVLASYEPIARKRLQQLAPQLTSDQINEAKRRADQWKTQHPPRHDQLDTRPSPR